MKTITKLALIATVITTSSTMLTAASFDCAKAQTKVEHAICDDKQLSTLDSEMGKLYKQIKSPDWKKIHKNLVKMRNKEAGKYSDPTNYLIKWTKEQIKELKREISLGG